MAVPQAPSPARCLVVACLILLTGIAIAQDPPADNGTVLSNAAQQAQFADAFFNRGHYPQAAEQYDKLIKTFPDYKDIPAAHFYRGECFRLTGQTADALAAYSTLRQKHPKSKFAVRAGINAVSLHIEAKKVDEALKILNAMPVATMDEDLREKRDYYLGAGNNLKGNKDVAARHFTLLGAKPLMAGYPLRVYARLQLAFIHQSNGKYDDALKLLSEISASKHAPTDVVEEALLMKGEVSFIKAEYSQAAAAYAELQQRFPKSKFAPRAKLNHGKALLAMKKFQQVINLFKHNSSAEVDISAEALYLVGISMKQLRLYDDALTHFARARSYRNNRFAADAGYESLECLFELKKYDNCINEARAFVKANPRHEYAANAYFYLGQSLAATDRKADAAEAYETALKEFWGKWSFQEEAILILATIYTDLKDFKKAAATYRRFMPDANSKRRIQARMQAGECEMLHGDLIAAFRDYRFIVTEFPDSTEAPLALLTMCEIAVRQESHEEAVRLLGEFLTKYPTHAYAGKAYYLRGTLYFRTNKIAEAIVDLRKSQEMPDFPQKDFGKLFLAYALWENGDEPEALAMFEALLSAGKLNNDFAPDLLAEIGRRYVDANNLKAAESCYNILAGQGDANYRFRGEFGLARCDLVRGELKRASTRFDKLKNMSDANSTERGMILAYQGETLRRLKKNDEAIVAFEAARKLGTGDVGASALAQLGTAKIYYGRKDIKKALEYAYSVFLLYDDPDHSSEAMFLALKILVTQKKMDEAKLTSVEFKKRYPLSYEKFRSKPENAPVFKQLE
jgi:TolA-binding protein